ncbi:MAG: N-acetylmuramoyl-L-alanine amidase [Acidobacteriota bacterium]
MTGIRAWSHSDWTRVIVETSGRADFKADRAANPDRLFFDVLHASPWIEGRRYASRQVNDRLVRRVRIAETAPGTTRIVFDLTGPGSFRVSRLEAPNRLVIEIRPPGPGSETPAPAAATIAFRYPPRPVNRVRSILIAPNAPLFDPAPLSPPYLPDMGQLLATYRAPRPVHSVASVSPKIIPAPRPVGYEPPSAAPRDTLHDEAPARASENASRSLTRALGLKVNRIVIDAGHGGHDEGTRGPNGVLEKDVVLDVALRLSRLVQSRMGADVVLTRSDDTFIPLQERTVIANARKADLFLSIHANSSPSPVVAGTETFFLNFTSSTGALDVAARENAGAEKSVGELKDLIQSITLNDKIAESQTFAQTIQNSIFAQASKSNLAARNRGVKRAPFVVLIGASMPSVLAEIGFLTNARDEANLGKPEYRQKIAEALYKGLSQYAQSLSHFEVANSAGTGGKPVMIGSN